MIHTVLNSRFRIEESIAQSPNGEVYRATDLSTNQPVALKVLRPRFLVGKQFGARLRHEFRLLSKLRHPNVVRVIESGETPDNLHYLAMEFVAGKTLKELVAMHGGLPPDMVARLLDQVAHALDTAHGLQVVHRDLKPGNIMVFTSGPLKDTVKLLDFGLAKVFGDEQMKTSLSVTGPGVILGDPTYMSPEQAAGRTVDHMSDVYALGVTTYYLLVGRPPFTGNDYDVMIAHSNKEPPPFAVINPQAKVPAVVEDVVRLALAKSPGDRPYSAGEFARLFREALAYPTQKPRPVLARDHGSGNGPGSFFGPRPAALPRRHDPFTLGSWVYWAIFAFILAIAAVFVFTLSR